MRKRFIRKLKRYKMDTENEDLARLDDIVSLVKSIFPIIQKMETGEYKRFRSYISDRFDVDFPYDIDKINFN